MASYTFDGPSIRRLASLVEAMDRTVTPLTRSVAGERGLESWPPLTARLTTPLQRSGQGRAVLRVWDGETFRDTDPAIEIVVRDDGLIAATQSPIPQGARILVVPSTGRCWLILGHDCG